MRQKAEDLSKKIGIIVEENVEHSFQNPRKTKVMYLPVFRKADQRKETSI